MFLTIRAEFKGILADWVGTRSHGFRLPVPASFADLLRAVGESFGPNMPAGLWDADKGDFKPAVMADIDGRSIHAPGEPLRDGETVRFMLLASGG